MDNPGVYALAVIDLTAALSAQAYTAIEDLDGMSGCTLDFDFQYGSGGTSCSVLVQTSFDGGTTYLDVARVEFLLASRHVTLNLAAGANSWDAATYAALAAEGIRDGVLGDRLRAKISSTGVYANTSLGVHASVR